MVEYFEILETGKKPWTKEGQKTIKEKSARKEKIAKSLTIKNITTIKKNTEFYVVEETNHNGNIKFFDLYDTKTYERILRLKHDEYF